MFAMHETTGSCRDLRAYGFLRGQIFADLQKIRSFWRFRRQIALVAIKIEDEDQALRQNASHRTIKRQFYPPFKAENLSELPEPPQIALTHDESQSPSER